VKIFIVDDSDIERKLLVNTLQKAGIDNEILQATDGKEALEVLEAEYSNICLMFLDWQIPKIDGLEILKRVAQNPNTSSLPVVMFTSTSSPESEEIAQLLNPNLVAFLIKPIEPEKIIEITLPLLVS